MKWFKKSPEPFDDYFAVAQWEDPSPASHTELRWIVPPQYYAQILAIRVRFSAYEGLAIYPVLYIEFSRGSIPLYAVAQSIAQPRGYTNYINWAVEGPEIIHKANLRHNFERLPPCIYLYPGDVMHIKIENGVSGDYFNFVSLVMKQWWL